MKTIFLSLFLFFTPVHMDYDPDCCGGKDCHPIPCEEISQDKDGYRWNYLTFKTVRASKDNQCHVCHSNNIPYCLYILQTT